MRIFISYRRDDAGGHAGRLFDTLQRSFPHPLFMDVEGIEGAQDFQDVIEREIEQSDVLLAVIGPNWAGARADGGPRRIDEPRDFVRLEIETAVHAGIDVVPVLVWGASMPTAAELPRSLRGMARLNAVELSDRRWGADSAALVAVLRRKAWKRDEGQQRQASRSLEVAAIVRLDERITSHRASRHDVPCSLVAGESSLLLASPHGHRLWFIELDEPRVLGSVRLRRQPLWRPTAAAAGLGHLWVADSASRAVWRMEPTSGKSYVLSVDADGSSTERIDYSRPRLGTVRGRRVGSSAVAVAAGSTGRSLETGVWVVTSTGRSGELLRLDPLTMEVLAGLSLPRPRDVAVGAGAVWIIASDIVAKIDSERHVVARSTPVGFSPRGLAVDHDSVWVCGDRLVARIDAATAELLGTIELPDGPLECLAVGAGGLWVGGAGTVHHVDPDRGDLVGVLDLSPGVAAQVRAIAVSDMTVCAAVADVLRNSFVALIEHTADASE